MSNELDYTEWLTPREYKRRSAGSFYSGTFAPVRPERRASIDLEPPPRASRRVSAGSFYSGVFNFGRQNPERASIDLEPPPIAPIYEEEADANAAFEKSRDKFAITPRPSSVFQESKDIVKVKRESGEVRLSFETGKTAEEGDQRREAPKDGGFWGWSTVIGAWIIQFCGFGFSNAFGVYQDYYTTNLLQNSSSSQISWIGSTQVFFLMATGIITGRLFDKGYFYHLVVAGTVLLILSLFMLSLVKAGQFYQIFLSQGVAFGLGAGMTYIPSVAVVSQHFPSPHMRSLVMCIVASGSSFGGIIHPIMLNNLFKGSLGFANGTRASAGMIAGLQIIAALMMRAKYPKYPPGQQPQMIPMTTAISKFSRDLSYMCLIIGMFLFQQGVFFPIFYIQVYAIKHGLNQNFSFYTLSIMNGASLIGRVVPGFLAGSIGVFNMVMITAIACNALLFSLFGISTTGTVAAFAILFGFFSGAYVSLLAPTMSHMADHYSEIGARMGIGFAFAGVGALIGTPITGAILTDDFIWWKAIVYGGAICGGGLALFTIARFKVWRKRGMWVS